MSNLFDLYPTFFGYFGVASALVLANMGAAYGTAKSGVGICSTGSFKPDLIIKSIIPVIMAGILGIYGLIESVILIQKSKQCSINTLVNPDGPYTAYMGFKHMASGLCCGLSSFVYKHMSFITSLGCWDCDWHWRRCRSKSPWPTG